MSYVDVLLQWCQDGALFINENKTIELIVYSLGEYGQTCQPVIINNQAVEEDGQFKYLGLFL